MCTYAVESVHLLLGHVIGPQVRHLRFHTTASFSLYLIPINTLTCAGVFEEPHITLCGLPSSQSLNTARVHSSIRNLIHGPTYLLDQVPERQVLREELLLVHEPRLQLILYSESRQVQRFRHGRLIRGACSSIVPPISVPPNSPLFLRLGQMPPPALSLSKHAYRRIAPSDDALVPVV